MNENKQPPSPVARIILLMLILLTLMIGAALFMIWRQGKARYRPVPAVPTASICFPAAPGMEAGPDA